MLLTEKEWEKFWKWLLEKAWDSDAWWLTNWLEAYKEEWEDDNVEM
jgi:hypothetical protein